MGRNHTAEGLAPEARELINKAEASRRPAEQPEQNFMQRAFPAVSIACDVGVG
jgi:hypothetical protein